VIVAFTAGLLTFFSPCFLPLVPVYLVYITGLSLEEVKKVKLLTVIHSLLFILGFTVVFVALGTTASLLGQFLYEFGDILRVIGGGLIILLGLYLLRIIKLPFLDIERKITISSKPAGFIGTFFVGIVFALGWSPCVGPILGGILILASQSQTINEGIWLLVVYSLGLGLPLFLASLAVNYSLSLLKRVEKYLPIIHGVCGVFLVIVGILLATNLLQQITFWLVYKTGYGGL